MTNIDRFRDFLNSSHYRLLEEQILRDSKDKELVALRIQYNQDLLNELETMISHYAVFISHLEIAQCVITRMYRVRRFTKKELQELQIL